MKLRTQFVLSVVILAVVLLAMSGFAIYTSLHVHNLRLQQDLATGLERQANDLSYISNNYLLYREPSQIAQWDSTFASFSDDLAAMRLGGADEIALLEGVRANSERARAVFSGIVSASENVSSSDFTAERAFLRVSWSRMEVQNRQMVFDSSRLRALLARHVDAATLLNTIVLFVLIGVFGLLLLGGYLFIFRRIRAGLSVLQAGTEIVGTGDLNHVIPGERRDEFGDLSRAFNKMTADLKSMGNLYESQRTIALKLQHSLLDIPQQIGGVHFGHLYRSATLEAWVGGDFYDVFALRDGQVAVLIGDVSGHGVEAARVATLVKDVVHAFAHHLSLPSAVVASTNELLIEKAIPGFVTLFFGILDPESGSLSYCSAGHPNALLRNVGGQVELLEAASLPLGVFRERSWKDSVVTLNRQDLLFLYTDGAMEARKNGDYFGQTRLADILKSWTDVSPEKLPQAILDAVLAYTGGLLADDVALLAVRLTSGSAGGTG